MGHNIVLNMENLHPKWKVGPHVFSAVMASASHGETLGQYCGWLVFLLFFKHKHTPPNAVSKYPQILFHFMTNQQSYSQLKMHKFSKSNC